MLNICTNSESKLKLLEKDALFKVIENLKTYELEIVDSMAVSKNFSDQLKAKIPEEEILVDKKPLELPFNLTSFAGIKFEVNEALPDHLIVIQYQGGDKEIFNLENGVKHRIPSYDKRNKTF